MKTIKETEQIIS